MSIANVFMYENYQHPLSRLEPRSKFRGLYNVRGLMLGFFRSREKLFFDQLKSIKEFVTSGSFLKGVVYGNNEEIYCKSIFAFLVQAAIRSLTMNITNGALSAALAKLRVTKSLSAKELSIQAGFPDYTVSRIENGRLKPDLLVVYGLVKALGVSMDEFVAVAENLNNSTGVKQLESIIEARRSLSRAREMLISELAN